MKGFKQHAKKSGGAGQMKLVPYTKYKTYDEARQRCVVENRLAKGEFTRGSRAVLYHYAVVPAGDWWRIARLTVRRAKTLWPSP
jgi:hypothetical protein